MTSAQAWFTSVQLQSQFISAVVELQSALRRMSEAWDGESDRCDRGKERKEKGVKGKDGHVRIMKSLFAKQNH